MAHFFEDVMYSWQDNYIHALLEKDPEKLRRLILETKAAIEQRRLSPIDPEERDAVERAEKALKILNNSLTGAARVIEYWRVYIEYTDGKVSANKVFNNKKRAEEWAERQERSKVVRRCRIESFTRVFKHDRKTN
jgi:hypothetical protein